MDTKKIRWGILGCADIAERRILPAMTEVNNGELYAIATRGPSERLERVRAKYAPQKICGYDELLADPQVDAVYIPLPNDLHVEWTVKAAKAGKHVLCEKPIACRVSELAEIREAAKRGGVHVTEAFACLHSPLYPAIRELVAQGKIGELRAVEAVFCSNSATRNPGRIKSNLLPENLGGSIHDVGCYNLLSIRQITGREPVSVYATAHFLPTGVDGTVLAVLDMGDGILGYSKSSKEAANNRGLTVHGSGGVITFPKTPNTWGRLEITLATPAQTQVITLEARNNYAAEMEQLGRCILDGETPVVTLEQSEGNIRAMQMVHRAIGSWMAGS